MAKNNNKTFRQCVSSQLNKNITSLIKTNNGKQRNNSKLANISRISPLIFSKPSKSVLAKSKFYPKNHLFTQATKGNIEEILKIKEVFSKLSPGKIIKIQNKNRIKNKPKLNITTKEPSRKQTIIPMSSDNINVIILYANKHISNMNRLLKNIKSDVLANYIQLL